MRCSASRLCGLTLFLALVIALSSCSSGGEKPSVGTVGGHVRDYLTQESVQVADVAVGSFSTKTDHEGDYFLPVDVGDYLMRVEDSGHVTCEIPISVGEATYVERDFEMFPLPATRFVLTWDDESVNLDAHVWVPMGTGTYDHIWKGDYGSAGAPPYAILDADVDAAQEPETVYIRPGTGDYYPGSYHFAVRHVSGDGSIATSGARVDVYRGNELRWSIEPPQEAAPVGSYWYVGRLDCRWLTWVADGTYSNDPPLPDA